ncbi:50S ribosomal protein L27, chloroplastic [Tanacetum coccineum]
MHSYAFEKSELEEVSMAALFEYVWLQALCSHIGNQVHPGKNVGIGKDHTIFTLIDGLLKFEKFGPHRKKNHKGVKSSNFIFNDFFDMRFLAFACDAASAENVAFVFTSFEFIRLGSKLSKMEVKQLMEAEQMVCNIAYEMMVIPSALSYGVQWLWRHQSLGVDVVIGLIDEVRMNKACK